MLNDKCSVCGKELYYTNGSSMIGVSIRVESSANEKIRDYQRRQTSPYELDVQYLICFGCWLASLGIKPEVKHADK